jgi:hypothetical protein
MKCLYKGCRNEAVNDGNYCQAHKPGVGPVYKKGAAKKSAKKAAKKAAKKR